MKMRFNNTEYYDFIYGEDIDVSEYKVTSLEGAPEKIGGSIYCSDNLITSLEGAPEKIGRSIYCSDNLITSLEGYPYSEDINSDFNENESN